MLTDINKIFERVARQRKAPQTFEDAIDFVHAVEKEIMVERQRKYGKANITEGGEVGIILRNNDKQKRMMQRVENLIKTGKWDNADFDDESVDDTWADLANYPTIALMNRWKFWELPLAEDVHPVDRKKKAKKKQKVKKEPTVSTATVPFALPNDTVSDSDSTTLVTMIADN